MVGLTMTSFSEKMLISNRFLRGLMTNLSKKSVTVSRQHTRSSSLSNKKTQCHASHNRVKYFLKEHSILILVKMSSSSD